MSVSKLLVRVLLGLLALVLLLVGFVVILATTTSGQEFVTQQVNSYLAQKFHSPFRIGRIRYEIPDYIELENVFFKTPQGDTLLDGGRMRVDLDMWGLLDNRVAINQIDLEHVRLNIKRTLPDTTFNFQYILDAFIAPGDTTQPTTPVDTSVAPLAINLTGIFLKDVRIKYKDDVVGADVNTYVDSLRARFKETDVDKSRYYLSNVSVDGLVARTRLYEGLPTPPDPPSDPADTLDIGLGKWTVNRAKWDVRVETADFQTRGSVGRLTMESNYFHLNGEKIGIKSLDLTNADIAATLTKPTKKAASTPPAAPATGPGWQAKLTNVRFVNNRIQFDDETAPRQKSGLDYGHLDLRNLGIAGKSLVYQDLGKRGQLVSGQLRNGQFRSTSGFVLQEFDANVLYSDTILALTDLLVKTPTTLLRDRLVVRYDSLAQLTNPRFADQVAVRLNLRDSYLSVSDVLQLAPFLADTPPFAGNRGGVFRSNAQATGTLAALNVPRLEFDMLSGTRIRANGRLTNVTDTENVGLDLTVQEAVTTLADINKLAPKGSIPESIALPPALKLTGKIQGKLNDLNLDAKLSTDWGTADFDGRLAGFVAGKNQTYKGTLNLDQFDAGKWLKQPENVGKLTGRATFDGRGIDVNTLSTKFDLNVQSAEIQGYTYQNLDAGGTLTNGNLDVAGTLKDPNANLNLDMKVGLKGEYPSVVGQAVINELNLQKLKLYTDPLSLKGRILLDMATVDPDRPVGTVSASDAVVTLSGKSYPVDSLYARLSANGPDKAIVAQLPGARLNLTGQFKYDQLYDIVVGEISKYLSVPDLAYKPVQPPYALTVNLKAYQNPLLQAFVPALTRLDTVRLSAYLDNRIGVGPPPDTTLSATLRTGVIVYDTITVQPSNLALRAVGNQLNVAGHVDGVLYSGYKIGPTNLSGTAANNRFGFAVVSNDSIGQARHGAAGMLSIVDSSYRLQLARSGLLLNYQRWRADTTGFAQYGKDGVLIDNLHLESGDQTLEVSSTEPYGNAPLRITTRNIELANLAKLANQDTTLASGELNGTLVVRDYLSDDNQLSFIGSVYVDSLRVTGQPIGNLTARFRNEADGRINVNTALSGSYNDATVTGFYNPDNAAKALDLTIDLKRLDARTIQAFSFGELRQAKGQLTGQFTVAGAVDNPKLDGSVAFDSVAFNIKQINTTYLINQEKLTFAGQTITLTDFDLHDTRGRTLTTNGTVVLKNLPDAAYDLRVQANGFQVLNAARKDNDYAYGQAAVTADMRIKGAGADASITGRVRLEDGSKITAVLPDETLTANEANDVVTFINHSDSLALTKYLYQSKSDSTRTDRLAFDQLSKANISLDLEANEKSEIIIIIDELNGDYLRARGNARLNVGVNAAGQITVLGRYDITEGEYSMTYQVLKRQFEIQKGGYINFTGDPLKADINITAVYKVEVAPADLIGSESTTVDANALRRKLPFEVALTISDNLASPKLDFDIRLPEAERNVASTTAFGTAIENKLRTLRQDQSQINKQVFALLILNRFLPENTQDFFSGGSGGGLNAQAESVARSSVSKLISDQLGQLASNVLKGFDVDFNLLSQNSIATGNGGTGSRTDLNVGLSRTFLDGRLTVSVGKNFVLENTTGVQNQNQVFDNISVNYNLTRDGRYVLRAYRRNDYQAVLDGYVIETGVGFIITVDYNTLADVFRGSPGPPAPTMN